MKHLTIILILLGCYPFSSFGDPKIVKLWRHDAREIEITASFASIKRFNESQSQWKIVPDLIPEASYTLSTTAAAQAGLLPCVIEIDQPLVPSFAWKGYIRPLDELIDEEMLQSVNTTAKGIYNGKVYSIGPLDVSLALFTRKSLINQIKARYPTLEHPWSRDEFMAILKAVKATGEYKYPFDIRAHDTTEWIPYAWAPMMLSWGADLIDRSNNITVDGFMNSDNAIKFGEWIQYLVQEQYIDPTPPNDEGFIRGTIAVQYGGSWALSSYYNAFKEDLAVLPVPDFGNGSFVGGGTWHWAITESCQHPEAAVELITFLMTAEETLASSSVMGIFPTNSHTADLSEDYGVQGKWRILYELSTRTARFRPATPAYSVISSSYIKAMSDIVNGMPPAIALDLAVENINAAFDRHQNYITPYR